MAFGDNSSPVRYLGGQVGSTNRELALDIFGGEVLAAFDLATVFYDKVESKQISFGRSARFPKTWKATAEYFTPGKEMLGNDIDTTEITVTVDDILVSHFGVSDLDEMLSHFETRSKFSDASGKALAKVYDKNVARQIVLAARSAADGPFPGGHKVINASCTNSGAIDGLAWLDQIRDFNGKFFDADVPEDMPRYLAVNHAVFEAIKYAKDSNGNYLVLSSFLNGGDKAGGISGRAQTLEYDGVTIIKTRNMPNTDETADATVYTKYRADYSTVTGIFWSPMAVATLQLMSIGFETQRDSRRLEDFNVAKMLVGHGTLRPECAAVVQTA